jgi:hypothetical protein
VNEARPLVGIGMPVFNAELYIRGAVDSLLEQTYDHFELTISDNASQDATEAICREYAQQDPRVRYHRLPENRGAVWNFNHVFTLSRGTYFTWAAHDDLRASRYLEACVAALEEHPEAALCCTDIRIIGADGAEIPETVWPPTSRPIEGTLRDRMQALARARYWYDFYCVSRADALRRTRLALPVWGFDVVVLAELMLTGDLVYIPEKLLSYRLIARKPGEAASGLAPPGGTQIHQSWTELSLELLRGVARGSVPRRDRLSLALDLLDHFVASNAIVNDGIHHDGLASVRRAVKARRLGSAVELLALAVTARGSRRFPGLTQRMAKLRYQRATQAGGY